jgi:hypothetical protein
LLILIDLDDDVAICSIDDPQLQRAAALVKHQGGQPNHEVQF